jgi:hypothetical protein
MAVSLVCTTAIRPLTGGTAADDPEAVMATFLPRGLDLLSKVVAEHPDWIANRVSATSSRPERSWPRYG